MPSVTKIVGTGANEVRSGSGTTWREPTRITADDGTTAENNDDLSNLAYSDYLVGTMAGNPFAISDDQRIDGVKVEVEWSINGTDSGQQEVEDLILVSSLGDGDNKGDGYVPTTTPTTRTYGGPTDKWNIDLTPAVVNADSFGAKASTIETLNGNGKKALVDFMRITIYYSPIPPATGLKQTMVI